MTRSALQAPTATARQHFAAFGLAAAVTLSLLTGLVQLAEGYQQDTLAQAAIAAAATVAASSPQQVVITGQRQRAI